MPKNLTLYSIQYLRALAALAVVVVHTELVNPISGQQGVDVFFVISGFIMMHVSRREPRPLEFLLARATRVIPLYWLATLAWAALHPATSLRNLLLSLAFVPHLQPSGETSPVIMQGWTLVFEVFFYASFSAALVLPRRLLLPTLTIFIVALSIAGIVLHPASAAGQTYLSPLLLEFLAGAWLQRAVERDWLKSSRLSAIILAIGIVLLVPYFDYWPGAWRIVLWGFPAILIVTGAIGIESRLPHSNIMLLLGNASYAIYLTHTFALMPFRNRLGWLPGPIALPMLIAISAIVGVGVHLFIERPLAKLIRCRHSGTPPLPVLRPL